MNAQEMLPGLRAWFEEYTERFSSQDPGIQQAMDLKIDHTMRVCEAILDIGRNLGLSREDLALAEGAALLHDIGRFEQYSRYRTFSDHRSEDHAALGVKVIAKCRVLRLLEPAAARIVLRAVRFHNRAALPEGEGGRERLFQKLLRDADKVDIWRVATDYYRNNKNGRNHTIELDLPDEPMISEPVYRALMNRRLVRMAHLKTLNDFKLLQIGWIYDLNFPRSFQIVQDKGYLEMIRDALPEASTRVREVYHRAAAYLEQRSRAA
ncbi:MAG TPA: HD domain-containing protein [Deltaproteobacteria bacterium]|nr:HD domain-containing protein [Deltaproteobacteria bacterium]MBW2112667.1 HD domain-containing protein [Deltaproteobacteria bacterium]HDZ90757.1 HD domain-containing protein [Deltaproteobacteria bacterium]